MRAGAFTLESGLATSCVDWKEAKKAEVSKALFSASFVRSPPSMRFSGGSAAFIAGNQPLSVFSFDTLHPIKLSYRFSGSPLPAAVPRRKLGLQ
ncbi:hypothetical protein KFK09_027380 [Dendrobium nobile]|uniref:Uncharacterized protein n=1 Tax=Dendrobium nobile TaxID=94219 RepID=A0A8T3AAN5_DENNO|nr:hypothetical protein KFK09_027380 [Dendrobium nobile]